MVVRMFCLCLYVLVFVCWHATTLMASPLDTIAFVVNQGTFGTDNASLTRINLTSGEVDINWFADVNNGQKLGATANDIALKGDTAFITVTTSKAIEVVNILSGKSLGRILLDGSHEPWRIVLVSPTLGIVSTTNGDGIALFNPTTLQLEQIIHTGPATEGVAVSGGYAYVANSGYGDLRKDEPNAGTIAVVNLGTRQVERYLPAGPNVRELIVSEDGRRLYAFYQHLYSQTDSLQGIIEYDIPTMTELRRWRLHCAPPLLYFAGKLYVMNYNPATFSSSHILVFDLAQSSTHASDSIPLPSPITANGFAIDPFDTTFLVFDARDYQSNGHVYALMREGNVRAMYNVGVAPVRAAFALVETTSSVIEQPAIEALYPNPASTHCTIVLAPSLKAGTLTVQDVMGRTVLRRMLRSGELFIELSLEQLPAGIYTVVIDRNTTRNYEQLVIVR